jgi:hypothetical protein
MPSASARIKRDSEIDPTYRVTSKEKLLYFIRLEKRLGDRVTALTVGGGRVTANLTANVSGSSVRESDSRWFPRAPVRNFPQPIRHREVDPLDICESLQIS